MKKPFNNSPLQNGATCSLCQDTLLRHISQSRVFWYCPSCRQEMVCEEPKTSTDAIAPHISPVTPQRKLAKVTDISRHISVSAS
ncbi:MAG: hypothetical protein F6K11_19415 [Leptolyngbya sp. SIO3F4]|nr:hypothetical protein [Leptolyngbya sp. SIO3F4]